MSLAEPPLHEVGDAPGGGEADLTPEPALHRALGLTDHELEEIRARLGRDPNDLELAMFSVMWSEHCSYKSSRSLLRTLPTAGEGVVAGPGENAGVVRIGDGLAVAFKLESHNHPSAVEPYQGAATGVGGILRDIFTMGARPIAILDALKFGDPADARTRHLVRGVVRGVGGYGNCVGVPTVGGELVFHPSYASNPLVNVMAVGLLDERDLTRAAAPGPGNLAVLFGSTTGRDGIGGASVLASATFGESHSADGAKRPTVQVGDPFAEKLLIEASLELIGERLLEGLQDLGAAGITCATSETADRAGTGIEVDLDAIPRREGGMAPFEVMISESQERMLAIVRPERLEAVLGICRRWGLPAAVVGRVTDDGDVTVVSRQGVGESGTPRELARIPARALTSEAIVYDREARPPTHIRRAPAPGAPELPHDGLPERGMDPGAVLVVLGEGPLREPLRERAKALGVADALLLPGRAGDIVPWLERAEVFVHPARWEGFGLVLLEAMLARLPIVASRVSSIPEIVRDGETGDLVPPGDAGAFAAAVRRTLREPELGRRQGEAGLARARAHFSETRMAEHTLSVYERAMRARPARRPERGAGGGTSAGSVLAPPRRDRTAR